MKPKTASDLSINVLIYTNLHEIALLAQRTLSHIYPGIRVDTAGPDSLKAEAKPGIAIVDTRSIHGAPLDHILDRHSETPTVILINDLTETRNFSRHLTSYRTIITVKDIEGMGLIQAVHHLLERLQLKDQLRKTSHHLKELSIRDDLTRLFNHHHMSEVLHSEIKKSNRYKRPLSLIIIGVKNFTALNESQGHYEGDRVLARTADIIRSAVREVDIPARYGDNEFAVILPETDEPAARVVAARIQQELSSITLSAGDHETPLITSVGVAALSKKIEGKDELLGAALKALLQAKKEQVNAICSVSELPSKENGSAENRKLMEELMEKMSSIAATAEKSCFQSVIKLFTDVPLFKKTLLPHSERVAFFAQRLAERAGLGSFETMSLYRAGLLHDAGKLALIESLVMKEDRLTKSEYELMKQHPAFALQLMGQTSFLKIEPDAILYHHERFDGLGYPEGIAGGAIPLTARILSIAEAWDAMVSSQVYRKDPLKLDSAIAELKNGAGTQFDPELAEQFVSLITG